MLLYFFLTNKFLWIVAWALQSIGYYFVLKKMDEEPTYAIIPFLAEWRITKQVYPYTRYFFRPFFVTLVLVIFGVYLNPFKGMGRLLIYIAALIYLFFLFRLYNRLRKAFGKSFLYIFIYVLFPPLFLLLLGLIKSNTYTKPVFHEDESPKLWRFIKKWSYALFALAEIAAVTVGVGFLTIQRLPPRIIVESIHNDIKNETKDIKEGANSVISREEALGDKKSIIANMEHSRDYYFPSHENDKNVVVLGYVIGSNLENGTGLASYNIDQMIETTKAGENLTYVLQAGGSDRWFTRGILEDGNGRYVIKNGQLETAELLDSRLCMSEEESLADFLKWAKANYPADRYMLVFWDHGGGFSLGYGVDELNKKENGMTLLVSEMVSALESADMKFDMIGFDACLMQTIEIAKAMEPFADYYIASEEVEGGFGWFYTHAFSQLAKNPGMPTVDFAKELISGFDGQNTAVKKGEVDSASTLSVVDLTMVKPVYAKLETLFQNARNAILDSSEYYADISVSAQNAYSFHNDEQVDLVHYLTILNDLDYEGHICKDNACLVIADEVKAMIPYRNKNSAEGVNGMALTFPTRALQTYNDSYIQLKNFKMQKQMEFYNDYFSIMAAQQNAGPKTGLAALFPMDYTKEDWYVTGFERYETTDVFIDLPLVETEDGYLIDLPEKVNKLVMNVETAVYQKDGDKQRYLGRDYIGFENKDGKMVVGMDNNWVHINNHLISYIADNSRETEEGTIFTGTTKAILNRKDEVILQIEWDPIKEGDTTPRQGKVLGYSFADDETAVMNKGLNELRSGDRLEFLFDMYDAEGNFLNTEKYGSTLLITNEDRVTVKDQPLEKCDIEFFGILTDIYQREFTTEKVQIHID